MYLFDFGPHYIFWLLLPACKEWGRGRVQVWLCTRLNFSEVSFKKCRVTPSICYHKTLLHWSPYVQRIAFSRISPRGSWSRALSSFGLDLKWLSHFPSFLRPIVTWVLEAGRCWEAVAVVVLVRWWRPLLPAPSLPPTVSSRQCGPGRLQINRCSLHRGRGEGGERWRWRWRRRGGGGPQQQPGGRRPHVAWPGEPRRPAGGWGGCRWIAPPTSHRPTWPSAAPHFAPLPTSTTSLTASFDFGFGVRVQRSDRPSNFCQVLFRIVPSIVNRLWNFFSLCQDIDGGPQWNWFLGIYQRTYVAHVYSTNTKTPSASLWANSSTVPIHSWF